MHLRERTQAPPGAAAGTKLTYILYTVTNHFRRPAYPVDHGYIDIAWNRREQTSCSDI